ncbi:MAG: hypothetical protein KF713_00310 [Turneriella sp.]|nr:hypothetical protein [Turneriella sp.]
MSKIRLLLVLVVLWGVSALGAAPLSSFNAYRDEQAIFNRYYSKAFLSKSPGWGLVFLNTEDYNNFFGLMEINLAYERTRLYTPNIIVGASWLSHKLDPKFFSVTGSPSYAAFRGTLALSYRPVDDIVVQVGYNLTYYNLYGSNSQLAGAIEQNPNLNSYVTVPTQQVRADLFFLSNIDFSKLRAKTMTSFGKTEGLRDLYLLAQGKLGEMTINQATKTIFAAGPLFEARKASQPVATSASELYSQSAQTQPVASNQYAQALRLGIKVDLFDIVHIEGHNRSVNQGDTSGFMGFSSNVWQDLLSKASQYDYQIGLTSPVVAPVYVAFHRSQAVGPGFEIGLDIAEAIRRSKTGQEWQAKNGKPWDAEWIISITRNVISEDPLLQIPNRWAFKFYYTGHYDLGSM